MTATYMCLWTRLNTGCDWSVDLSIMYLS